MNLAIGDLPQRKRQNCHSPGSCSKIMVILHLQGDPQNYQTNEMTLDFLHLHLTSTSNKWDSQSERNVFTSCPFTLGVHQTAPRRSSIFATSGKLRRLLQKSKWLFNNLGPRGYILLWVLLDTPSRKNAKVIENVVVFLFRRRSKQKRSPSISSEINHKVVQIYPDLMTDLVQTLQTCVSHKSLLEDMFSPKNNNHPS